jgi:hypothetical protein
MVTAPSRRALLGALALAPAFVAMPAQAAQRVEFSCDLASADPHFEAAMRNLTATLATFMATDEETDEAGYERAGDAYIAALDDVVAADVKTPRDFLRKFVALYSDGGLPRKESSDRMVANAKRLAAIGGN